MLNLNDWSFYSEGQRKEILNNLSALRDKVSLGFTITRPGFDLSTHQRLIREYGLRPVIRLGLAQPVIDGANAYLADEDLPAVYASITEWASRLAADGIRLNFDCGFKRCLLDDDQIETLVRAGTVLRFDCSPAVDVGPGLMAWRCLAFSAGPGVDLRRFRTFDLARKWFERRDIYLGPEKDACSSRQAGWCKGGCLARQVVRSANLESAEIKMKENIGLLTE